ncbi:MAG: DUF1957 domain-containing protein [Fimbriimonas sp.]|nr:DUF1957 domain-containing protein [Fimbriimonas sp.]
MPLGRFLLCLHTHMPYVLDQGQDWLNEAAAESYLPILEVLDRLSMEQIRPCWTIGFTPILLEQLESPSFHDGFEAYCLAKIDSAVDDRDRFEREGDVWLAGLAYRWKCSYERVLDRFRSRWNRSIVGGFKHFQEIGAIEILGGAATHGYLPLLGTDESCEAQIWVGVQTYRKRFGVEPRGFWIPECGYRPSCDWSSPVEAGSKPWRRRSTGQLLAPAGLTYFFVDSSLVCGSEPSGSSGRRFAPLAGLSRDGEYHTAIGNAYESYRVDGGLAVFVRDPETAAKVWSAEIGYPGDPNYLEFHKRQYPGQLRYWRVSETRDDIARKLPYDPFAAFERIGAHAADLLTTVRQTLTRYRDMTGKDGAVVAMYDTELFGHWWSEGPQFLLEFARLMHRDREVVPVTGSESLRAVPPTVDIALPEGSWGEGGRHDVWLNDSNRWVWESLYPAERRLGRMATEFAASHARAIVALAARELILAESSDWPFLIASATSADYAERRFRDHLDRFNRIADLAERANDGSIPPDEIDRIIQEFRRQDGVFDDLDCRYWAVDPLAHGEHVHYCP